MRLLVISHTPHYHDGSRIVGWGATVREIDHLAGLFDQVTHLAPLHAEEAPASSLPYTAKNIQFHPVHPTGGDTLWSRLGVLKQVPEYITAIRQELRKADIVHVRCPAAISLVALVMLAFIKKPAYRWVKYAGNWKPEGNSPLSYRLQRWLITLNVFHGVATVNGAWKGQPGHIHSFYNPCLTDSDLQVAEAVARLKELVHPYKVIFVGRLEAAKGADTVLQIAAGLKNFTFDFEVLLIGDGPQRNQFERQAAEMHLQEHVHFCGWTPRNMLDEYYANAHFILLPSTASEGWPKVLSEAMAFGTVVLASNISSIPQILELTQAGIAIDPKDPVAYLNAILKMGSSPERWKEYSQAGMAAAQFFTYTHYSDKLIALMRNTWGINPLSSRETGT